MMTFLVAFFCSESLHWWRNGVCICPMGYVEEGFFELSTYLTHVGDDKAKMNKGYVRICRCCGVAWLCSQSLDFWASPGTTRACCSCPTHVNCVNCVCNVTRWNKGKNQGRQERNRPKFAHKTAPKPISNVPEAVCRLQYPQYHRNGERHRELAPEPQMRRAKVEGGRSEFFWRTCVRVCPSFRHGTV